jgi:imidazolonepropionase-like amidohydrolase
MRLLLVLVLSVFGGFDAGCHAVAQDLVIEGAKVYVSPDAAPLTGVTVVVRSGRIVAVTAHRVSTKGVEVLPCEGCVVCAGFWNAHVHFMEVKWADAAHAPTARLAEQMRQMVTWSGFTSVIDTGSDPRDTVALRRRVENGEIPGPRIYTAGIPLYPPHALPFYLADLPADLLDHMEQPANAAEVDAAIERNLVQGTDVVKLFTGSYVTRGHVVPMPLALARRAAEDAHRHRQIVFAHPSNAEGVRVAMESGVDVLAHAPDMVEGIDDVLLRQLVAHHMTMVPTLKLFSGTDDIPKIREIVKKFHSMGGELMFGTDTGFLTDYDVTEEYRQLYQAGLSYRDVLAMLTTAPARRLGMATHQGTVAVGMDGDLTILSADPALGDPAAFSQVAYTIRRGHVLYRHDGR